jgi:hypothetical protein
MEVFCKLRKRLASRSSSSELPDLCDGELASVGASAAWCSRHSRTSSSWNWRALCEKGVDVITDLP